MQLTRFTDYSIRVLLYVGLHPERVVSIGEISEAYGISRNHLLKIVHRLARLGFLASSRGRGGGLRLGVPPEAINLGDVVRQTEPHFDLVECFNPADNTCRITPVCTLKSVFRDARDAFLAVLDRHSLADLLVGRRALTRLLG